MKSDNENKKSLLKQLRDSQDLPETLVKGGNGSGTMTCYKVEARMCHGCGPKEIKNIDTWNSPVLTDSKWATLSFPTGSVGVPSSSFGQDYARYGYLSYQAAQALRWWFLAEQGGVGAMETRLVQYEFEYSYTAKPIRAICVIDPEQREDILPDWGKQA